MNPGCYYRIENFSPLGRPSAGAYNFNILLDREFALRAINTGLLVKKRKSLESIANSLDRSLFGNRGKLSYVFEENTCLLFSVSVPGNATSLNLTHPDLWDLRDKKAGDRPVKYVSSNVDSPIQAYGLLSKFYVWFESVEGRVLEPLL